MTIGYYPTRTIDACCVERLEPADVHRCRGDEGSDIGVVAAREGSERGVGSLALSFIAGDRGGDAGGHVLLVVANPGAYTAAAA